MAVGVVENRDDPFQSSLFVRTVNSVAGKWKELKQKMWHYTGSVRIRFDGKNSVRQSNKNFFALKEMRAFETSDAE